MFEVGKKYGGIGDNSDTRFWLCVAVDGEKGWLKPTGMGDYKEGIFPWHGGWRELPPEPKRWSTWQNIYSNFDSVGRGVGNFYPSKKEAYVNGMSSASYVSIIRRDFEQHEGKASVCVKCELEKIDTSSVKVDENSHHKHVVLPRDR